LAATTAKYGMNTAPATKTHRSHPWASPALTKQTTRMVIEIR